MQERSLNTLNTLVSARVLVLSCFSLTYPTPHPPLVLFVPISWVPSRVTHRGMTRWLLNTSSPLDTGSRVKGSIRNNNNNIISWHNIPLNVKKKLKKKHSKTPLALISRYKHGLNILERLQLVLSEWFHFTWLFNIGERQ